jgi:serine/threonine-protein kinase
MGLDGLVQERRNGLSIMHSGQTIAGKYRLNQPIGAGGMASVWSATNVYTERQFAIKFMHPAVAKTPEAAHRFLMEAKVSARVNHPNIIEIIDVGQAEDGALFLVMELLQGVSLETAIKRQSPPMLLSEFVGLMIDVARALAAAHKNGVVHRDLKPTNIFLHMIREGVAVPKLLDFGVSKFVEESNHALTVAGTVLGSPLYMSPEQARGLDTIDGRTDVFAFGTILFEAIAGVRPYDGTNFNALIVMIATTEPRSIDESAPSMPEGLRAIVRDCIATDREKRIANFEEIVDRLLDSLPELEQSGLRLPSPSSTAPISDPEATSALPLRRDEKSAVPREAPLSHPPSGLAASQAPSKPTASRPPPKTASLAPGASPPSAFASPYASDPAADPGATTTIRSPPLHVAVFVALGALVTVVAVVITWFVSRGIGPPTPYPASSSLQTNPEAESSGAPSAASDAPPTQPEPSSFEIPEPPVVTVESLPVASSHAASPPKGVGRIAVTAAPGSCTVFIDGQYRGPTPVPAISLPAGAHSVSCHPPTGRVRTITVNSVEGMATRYKFNLSDSP